MAALTAALVIAQGVAQGAMAYAQGRQQAAVYQAQAQQEEANARIAERNRGTAADEAARSQEQARQRYALTQGQNVSQLAAGGLDSSSGLASALGRANMSAYNTDTMTINQNLGWKDTDLRQQIANSEANAKNYRQAAKSTRRTGLLNGVLTTASGLVGLGGASRASTAYNPYNQYGTFYQPTYSSNYGW